MTKKMLCAKEVVRKLNCQPLKSPLRPSRFQMERAFQTQPQERVKALWKLILRTSRGCNKVTVRVAKVEAAVTLRSCINIINQRLAKSSSFFLDLGAKPLNFDQMLSCYICTSLFGSLSIDSSYYRSSLPSFSIKVNSNQKSKDPSFRNFLSLYTNYTQPRLTGIRFDSSFFSRSSLNLIFSKTSLMILTIDKQYSYLERDLPKLGKLPRLTLMSEGPQKCFLVPLNLLRCYYEMGPYLLGQQFPLPRQTQFMTLGARNQPQKMQMAWNFRMAFSSGGILILQFYYSVYLKAFILYLILVRVLRINSSSSAFHSLLSLMLSSTCLNCWSQSRRTGRPGGGGTGESLMCWTAAWSWLKKSKKREGSFCLSLKDLQMSSMRFNSF